jgi:hypothetical protein
MLAARMDLVAVENLSQRGIELHTKVKLIRVTEGIGFHFP